MSEVIQVRMKEETVRRLIDIQNRVHAPSKSDALRRAVEITDVLVSAIEHGDKIIIEGKNGKQKQVLIAGLNK